MFCKLKSLHRAIEKAGYKIEVTKRQHHSSMREHGVLPVDKLTDDQCNISYRAVNGDHILTWHAQGDRAPSVHCGRISDPRDIMTDYFPGYFAHTIKSAVEHLNEAKKEGGAA